MLIKRFIGHKVISGVVNDVLYPSRIYYLLEVKPIKMLCQSHAQNEKGMSFKEVWRKKKSLPF